MISDNKMDESQKIPSLRVIPPEWRHPDRKYALANGHVDLWLAHTIQPVTVLAELHDVLSDEERGIADCQVTPALRDRSILARGLLRVIIGHYFDLQPETFTFDRNRYGKPMLAGEYADRCIFNKSHSGDLLLYGFTSMQDIGVDIECIRNNINLERLARRQLTPNEHERFMQLPEPERIQSFFQTWTRKEAVGKAIGKGLIFQMGSIDVSGIPGTPVEFLRRELADHNPDNWYIQDITDTCEGVCASVSTYGRIDTIKQFHADPEYLLNR